MPRLTSKQIEDLKADIMLAHQTPDELMLKYDISEPTYYKYKHPAKVKKLSLKLGETLVDTRVERKKWIVDIKETFENLRKQIEDMDRAKNPDGTISAGALNTILNKMTEISRELDRHWTAIEKAEGQYADTLIQNDNRQLNILQVTETAAPALIRVLHMWEGRVFSMKAFLEQFEEAVK